MMLRWFGHVQRTDRETSDEGHGCSEGQQLVKEEGK